MVELEQNDKYYTPTIDEFYVGFEYEYKGTGIRANDDGEWHPTIFNKLTELDHKGFLALLEFGLYRVKYLDRDDIESLGFEYVKKPWGIQIKKLKKEYIGKELKDSDCYESEYYYFLDYNCDKHNIYIHNNESYENHISWFDGTIKNKSELKVLLKQLGIDEK